MADSQLPHDAVLDPSAQSRRLRHLRNESTHHTCVRALHRAAALVDLGVREDGPALPDRSRQPDLGIADTDCAGDGFPPHGAVGEMGTELVALWGALCPRDHCRDHESECGIREDEDRGVGTVQYVRAG